MLYDWTEKDIEILKYNYKENTTKELQEKFFPNLTLSQIKNKIFSLGLTKTRKKCIWTEEEKKLLIQHYHLKTNRELKELYFNDKTELQIKDCAANLGLKKDIRATRGWTKECVDILYKYYNELSAKEISDKYLPQFSAKQIAEFASKCVGIHKDDEVIARNRLLAQDQSALESGPQKIVDELLDKLNIKYKREEIFTFYAIDNYLIDYNLAIEVQGDYWHVNPIKGYKYSKKRDNYVKKDINKCNFIRKKYGINILYLWENDIKNNIDVCKKMILEYIKNDGTMENYHSFNYMLDDNNSLVLIDNQYTIGY